MIKKFKNFKLNEATSINLSKSGSYAVKYPTKGFELYEAILAQLFSDFKNIIQSDRDYHNDNDRRVILSKFQKVFESCRRRFSGSKPDYHNSLEDLIDLSSATGLEGQIKDLLEDLGIEELTINWDTNHPMVEQIKRDEETRVTKKIFGIN